MQHSQYFHIETPRIKKELKLGEEYCTIDYGKFCRNVFRESKTAFLKADVHEASGRSIITSKGKITANFIVDCSGWRRVLSKSKQTTKLFSGIEITVPIKKEYEKSINFFVNMGLIKGYGWIFPVGNGLGRVGIGGYSQGSELNAAFMKFLDAQEIPFQRNELVGGSIPCTGLGKPVEEGIFFVGDSARQVLPLSAEGIRTTLYFADACATVIKATTQGKISTKEAEEVYSKKVQETSMAFDMLSLVQNAVISFPQIFFDLYVLVATSKPLQNSLVHAYSSIARY